MPDEPATKQDLQNLEANLRAAIAESQDQLKEFSRDLQTEVLKAIYEIVESGNRRMVALERYDIGITERFAALEDRLLRVEKRLNLPPGTAA